MSNLFTLNILDFLFLKDLDKKEKIFSKKFRSIKSTYSKYSLDYLKEMSLLLENNLSINRLNVHYYPLMVTFIVSMLAVIFSPILTLYINIPSVAVNILVPIIEAKLNGSGTSKTQIGLVGKDVSNLMTDLYNNLIYYLGHAFYIIIGLYTIISISLSIIFYFRAKRIANLQLLHSIIKQIIAEREENNYVTFNNAVYVSRKIEITSLE
ncbi:hypothetical protein [Desulfotomaculum copahuensis]|uniref:Uncharacterized protein n=1 Tax=Desulfotomaculum copahuensis TaxID=1838280 RepID=A0A1B7LCC4_9FIRM|nr:hypothetical protein [Desulfotomaculum copahuensis]OAT80389.1 hypothetical protein A6M21_13565 [Desulfotomaculum copahuensis]